MADGWKGPSTVITGANNDTSIACLQSGISCFVQISNILKEIQLVNGTLIVLDVPVELG